MEPVEPSMASRFKMFMFSSYSNYRSGDRGEPQVSVANETVREMTPGNDSGQFCLP